MHRTFPRRLLWSPFPSAPIQGFVPLRHHRGPLHEEAQDTLVSGVCAKTTAFPWCQQSSEATTRALAFSSGRATSTRSPGRLRPRPLSSPMCRRRLAVSWRWSWRFSAACRSIGSRTGRYLPEGFFPVAVRLVEALSARPTGQRVVRQGHQASKPAPPPRHRRGEDHRPGDCVLATPRAPAPSSTSDPTRGPWPTWPRSRQAG